MVGFVSFPGVLGRPHHHFGKCCFLFDILTCRSFFFQNLLSGLAVRNGTSSCVQVFFVNRNNGATQLELPQAPLEDFEESRQIHKFQSTDHRFCQEPAPPRSTPG